MDQNRIENPDDVIDLANGFMGPRALLAGARAGVFAALAVTSRSAAEVGLLCGLDARAGTLLLHALRALGLVERAANAVETGEPRYALTAVARLCLVPGSPRDLTGYLALAADTAESWGRLEEALRTGRPIEVSSQAAQEGAPVRHGAFIRGMRSTALGNAPICAEKLDWAALLGRTPSTLLDLGGGPGTYALEFARRWPELTATVLDLEETIAIAREVVSEEPDRAVSGRISFQAGDFHKDPLGGPYDCAWVSHIVHGHPEETLAPLLTRVREALAPGGAIAIHDFILDEGRARPPFAALFGLNMLVMSDHGRTYTQAELRALLEQAGFQGARHQDLGERRGISVMTAAK